MHGVHGPKAGLGAKKGPKEAGVRMGAWACVKVGFEPPKWGISFTIQFGQLQEEYTPKHRPTWQKPVGHVSNQGSWLAAKLVQTSGWSDLQWETKGPALSKIGSSNQWIRIPKRGWARGL